MMALVSISSRGVCVFFCYVGAYERKRLGEIVEKGVGSETRSAPEKRYLSRGRRGTDVQESPRQTKPKKGAKTESFVMNFRSFL